MELLPFDLMFAVFKYNNTKHNVYKVDAAGFKDCIVPPPENGFHSGNDVITLAASGKKWYICGTQGHCANRKQKLTVNVLAEGAPAPAPSAANVLMMSGYQIVMGLVAAAAMIFA